MLTNNDNYKIGSALHSLKPQENKSNINKNINNSNAINKSNDDFEINFDDKNNDNHKEIHNIDIKSFNINKDLNTLDTNYEEDDDFEIEFNEDADENKDNLNTNNDINNNKDTDDFEIEFSEDANENKVDSLEVSIDKSNNDKTLSLDITNTKSTPIYNSNSKDKLVTINKTLSDEFEFLYSYVEERVNELNNESNSLKEQSKKINLNIGDLNIDEDTILEKFNATMEIRSKLKIIESSCKIYTNIKELLDTNLK